MRPAAPGRPSPLTRALAKAVDGLAAWAAALALPVVGGLAGLVYLCLADALPGGQSLGKMVFGLQVAGSDGQPCDTRSSIYRNLPVSLAFLLFGLFLVGKVLLVLFGVPLLLFECWLMATDERGQRLGDRIAATQVAERTP